MAYEYDVDRFLADGGKPDDMVSLMVSDGVDPKAAQQMVYGIQSTSQKAPPTPQTQKSTEGQVPEWGVKHPNLYAGVKTGLDMAGGLGSLAKGSGVGMALGGAINAGAQALSRGIDGVSTTAKDVTRDATIGGLTEGAGRGIGKLFSFIPRAGSAGAGQAATGAGQAASSPQGQSLFNTLKDFAIGGPDAPIATPQAAANAARFKQATGLDMLPSDITRGKYPAMFERVMKMDPLTTNKMNLLDQNLMQGFSRKLVDPFLDNLGGPIGPQSAGKIAMDEMSKRSKAASRTATKLYDRVLNAVPDGEMIPTANLADRAGQFLDKINRAPESMRNPELMAQLEDLATNAVEYDAPTIKLIQSKINKIIAGDKGLSAGVSGMSSEEIGIAKQLASALDDDITAYSFNNPEFQKSLDLANRFYKDRVKGVFNTPIIKRAIAQQPDQVADTFFHRAAASDLENLKKAVGPMAFDRLKAAWLTKSLKVIEDGATSPYYNPKGLQQIISKMDDDTLKVIFSKKGELAEVKQLAQMGNMLRGSETIAGNPSGTAQNMIAYQLMKGGIGGAAGYGVGGDTQSSLTGAATTMLAPSVAARMMLSRSGRKLLTEGMSKNIGKVARGAFDAAVLGVANPNLNDPLGIRQ